MTRHNRKRTKRLRNLIFICGLTAIILSVSTYAWFIGMRTVNVSSFDVEIAATDSLLLSINGSDWDTTVAISATNYKTGSYATNTNTWSDGGLIPMSSVGDMDTGASRMKLYEKASLTTTPGGYRLLASRVNNTGATEQKGYVAFDLFVKNFSGTQYITALDPLDEEAIYLTKDSSVIVAADGVANTGIENSVRVAFGQIGRVIGTSTDTDLITGITCTTGSGVTGICRTAQIWEPNDKAHVANAISWYDTSCLKRTGTDVTLTASYTAKPEGQCNAVVNGTAYSTYAVSKAIASSDNVDVYDGPAYNGYVPELPAVSPLVAYNYLTDTEKMLPGVQRPTFMTLAPNSITKVRVYIYIEGQDIDNYDFASIGKKISVKFGFTKERFTEEDIEYNGPVLPDGEDIIKPVITLAGNATETVTLNGSYTDQGATATDNKDGNVTDHIVTTGLPIDTSTGGTYIIRYNVTDAHGNKATEVTRTVTVE